MKKVLLLCASILVVSCTMIFAQELTLKPYGVSPYMVTQDTVEQYFDKRFTGILNVGNETQMYLKGEFVDSSLISPTWTVIQEPSAGAGVFGATKDLDSSTQLIKFTVYATGTYKVVFGDGAAADTVTIMLVCIWVLNGTVNCVGCHNTSIWDFKYENVNWSFRYACKRIRWNFK